MEFEAHAGDVGELTTPVLAVPMFSDENRPGEAFEAADALSGGRLRTVVDEERFEAGAGRTLVLHTLEHGVRRLLVVGVGARDELQPPDVREMATAAVQEANRRKLGSMALMVPGVFDGAREAGFAVEGAVMGAYRYDAWRTREEESPRCERVTLVGEGLGAAGEAIARARRTAEAVSFARDLVNGPPIEVTPRYLAERAEEVAREGDMELSVLGPEAIDQQGMRLLQAVTAGSTEEPRFVHLTWRPEGGDANAPSIALVGKGITFDAGGYSLKPAQNMQNMKLDMAGAATVLGVMKALPAIRPGCVVHGIVPACENLVDGAAYKLGDIIRARSGRTVEILNTDAEGRLILADALDYTMELGVDRVVDLATLTGACLMALGPHRAGLFSNDDDFGERVREAADTAGEPVWRLPMDRKLGSMLETPNADTKNVGERWGGAITAALFLEQFVGDVAWTHLDIAGPGFATKADGSVPKGGTGFGVLSLVELLSGEL